MYYKLISVLFFLIITSNVFSQIDEIKKINGENIICKVDSTNPTHIFFHYPNEKESKYISKISTDYVRYSSGRFYKIENKEKYPITEKESFIKECYNSTIKNVSDTIHPIKKLNYCLNSFKIIESKIPYKDMYKINTSYLLDKSNPLLVDFFLDVYLINYNEIFNSNSFIKYQNFINQSTTNVCECISTNNIKNNDITKNSMDCIKEKVTNKFITDRKYIVKLFYSIFKDTSSDFMGEIVGGNLLKDIEKSLYDNCDFFLNEKIKERKSRNDKINYYNKDSLQKELTILLRRNNPMDDKYYINRGLLYFYLGEYEKSLSDFDKSYEISPKKISVLYFKYEVYDYLNDYENSIKYLKELNNKSTMNFNNQILLLEKIKSLDIKKTSL